MMNTQKWRWVLGLVYILAVAVIWIAASFLVQSVVHDGVSPFLVTYICNSLFVVYIPLVEIGRYLEDNHGSLLFWRNSSKDGDLQNSEQAILLRDNKATDDGLNPDQDQEQVEIQARQGLDEKGRWTRLKVAKVSLLVCPIWFMAQLTFNLSLKYTSVTSNTIMSSSSSVFTFLVALVFLGERFTWLKLTSVLLCMGGTIIVSLGDSGTSSSKPTSNPVLGDFLALLSSAFYAVYVTLIRRKLPDEDDKVRGRASMAQLLGFLGLFNLVIFLPVALVLEVAKIESFKTLTLTQLGLIVGKGLLDNVLSDYLWAKAVLLTTTTVASAGLSIQVPLAAIVDILIGKAPRFLEYVGAAVVMLGFAGINIPCDGAVSTIKEVSIEMGSKNVNPNDQVDL
ncbi:hypothetical protein ACJIZ3_016826 [Penstemon smallii]|uniref:EamA domain-containing protein n=1 Tax=Penstemon smallii TaxID=265156 RepID=A0ABD3STV8_9LAMI